MILVHLKRGNEKKKKKRKIKKKKGNDNRVAFISSTSCQHFTYLFNVLYNLKNVFRSAFSNTAAQQKYLGALQNHNTQEVPHIITSE